MTDKERIDFLQRMLDKNVYTSRCVLRMSGYGRGFRLHETSHDDSVSNVREAIDNFIEESQKST